MMNRAPSPPGKHHVHFDRSIYCARCTFQIENEIIKLDTRAFHVGCFVCEACKKSLQGITVKTNDNKNTIYCESCFIEEFPNICDGCHKPIIGDNEKFIKTKGKTYHHSCHVCAQCQTSLFKKRYCQDGGKKICQMCVSANRMRPVAPAAPVPPAEDMSEEL